MSEPLDLDRARGYLGPVISAEIERLRAQIAAVRALADDWARSTEQDPWASIYMDDAAEAVTEALDGAA